MVLRGVHDLFARGAVAGVDEGRLLERFVSRRDDADFEALVALFGPMVLGVCRRRLADPHDVEDAFQATFLVLVRKAATIRDGARLGNWLYGVACRVSARARVRRLRRREVTGEVEAVETRHAGDGERRELARVLDEELGRLPEKYRAPLVLCYLQGQTYEETARRLQWPVGTVRSRTARGRELMRSRLTRRGITLPGGLLAATLASAATEAAVPQALSGATVAVAARVAAGRGVTAGVVSASVRDLTRGVLRAMLLTKVRWAVVTGALTATLASSAWVIAGAQPGEKPGVDQEGEGASPGGKVKPGEPPAPGPDERARVVALERRLRELERELNAIKLRLRGPQPGDPGVAEKSSVARIRTIEDIRKIRPRFECLVEKIHVKAGQTVKKGDPLADVFSDDLVAAKNVFLSKSAAWDYQDKICNRYRELAGRGAIPQQIFEEADAKLDKCRLERDEARDRLALYGLSTREIEGAKKEEGIGKAQYTITAPIDGTVIQIEAEPQDLSDPKSVLMVLGTLNPKP